MQMRANAPAHRGLLTVDEFAAALGLSPKTIRQWTWRRAVPFVRVGRAIRFRQETVEEILNRGTVPPWSRASDRPSHCRSARGAPDWAGPMGGAMLGAPGQESVGFD